LSTQNPTQEEGSQAEGHPQTLNLYDWIITWKEYKPGRCKWSNKQNRRTRREKKLSHLGVDNDTEPGSDKPQPKIVRPIYVTPLKKDPDVQVDLPRTMMEQSKEWRNHNHRRMDKWDQTIYIHIQARWAMENRRACLVCLCKGTSIWRKLISLG
jgi:hypothetical protein